MHSLYQSADSKRSAGASVVVAIVCVLFTHVLQAQDPLSVIIGYPLSGGGVRYVMGTGDATWQVTERGIATRARSVFDTTMVAVAWSDFATNADVDIVGVEPVDYPVRIYTNEWPDGLELKAYRRVMVSETSGARRKLMVTATHQVPILESVGANPLPLIHRGEEAIVKAGRTRESSLPAYRMTSAHIANPYVEKFLGDVVQEELRQPVIISDPRIAFATYMERRAKAMFDREGNIVMSGRSPFFGAIPLSPDLYEDSLGVSNVRTTKLTKDRRVLWSTYYGPLPGFTVIAFDHNNDAVCISSGSGRSIRSTGYQDTSNGGSDIFVQKWSSDGRLMWTTYVGGKRDDAPGLITTDNEGNIYIAGLTRSVDFPTTVGQWNLKPNWSNRWDVVLFSLSYDGRTMRWGTYFGSQDTYGFLDTLEKNIGSDIDGLVYDQHGGVVLGMHQYAPSDLPITKNAWDTVYKGYGEAVLARFTTSGFMEWSTLISSTADDIINSVQLFDDSLVMIRFEEELMTVGTLFQRFPAVGVPGQTLTPEDKRGFLAVFNLDGSPRLVWAPFTSKIDGTYYQSLFGTSSKIIYTPPIGSNSNDAIIYDVAPGVGRDSHKPVFSLTTTSDWITYTPIYTSPILGCGGYSSDFHNGFILFQQDRFPSRGACLTDTAWGAGFGDNNGEQPYLVLLRPVVTSVDDNEAGLGNVDSRNTDRLQVFMRNLGDDLVLEFTHAVDRIEIYDMLGNLATSVSTAPCTEITMSLRSIAPGSYILRCRGTSSSADVVFIR
jgi:Beta-propeller repeat